MNNEDLKSIMTLDEEARFLSCFPKGNWEVEDIPTYLREREELRNDHIALEIMEMEKEEKKENERIYGEL